MAKILSKEDKDLNEVSLVTSRNKVYKDLDLAFAKRSTGDIYKKTDAAAVKQAVKILLSANRFDKPFNEGFGANIRGQLFELADEASANELADRIHATIEEYERRAQVTAVRVTVDHDLNEIFVSVAFTIINSSEEVTFETNISKLR